MTLSISNTIIDEEFRLSQTGTDDDDDVSVATFDASAFEEALTALNLTPFVTTTGFPQYAEQQDFVSSTNVVTNYFLASSATGGAFPATGTATTLYVGSNQIFLFATANSDIVVGRVGSGTTADPAGAIALVIGIEETKDGNGVVTQADMWLVLRAPIVQNGVDLVDAADQLDLSNLVFLGSTFDTTTEVPFENFDGLASGNNLFNVIFPSDGSAAIQLLVTGSKDEALSTVNVSTTGIGAGSQHIDVGLTLRIDAVSGMVRTNVDSAPEVNNSANIDYTARVELVAADFEVTQLNPGATPERATIKLSAFNAAGTSQEAAYLTNAIASDGAAVTIDAADVVVLNGAGQPATGVTVTQDGDSVIITGLDDGTSSSKTDGYQVFFTTDGVRFDRFLITNADGDGTTLDVGNIHVTSVAGGTDTEFAELGSKLIYQDDGPTVDLALNTGAKIVIDASVGADPNDVVGTPLGSEAAAGDEESSAETTDVGYALVTGAVLFTATDDVGADVVSATAAYSLNVTGQPATDTLQTSGGLEDITLFQLNATTILGRFGAADTTAFSISIDAATGNVTFALFVQLDHPLSDQVDEQLPIGAGLIDAVRTLTDGDGDSASDSVDLGAILFIEDDAPVILQSLGDDLQVGNTVGASDTSSFDFDPGGDAAFTFIISDAPGNEGTSTTGFAWTYDDATKTAITGTLNGVDLYTLTLDTSDTTSPYNAPYVFTLLSTLPSSVLNLSTAEIKAGAPNTNSIQVGAIENNQFVLISGASNIGAGNINESNAFVGVDNGNLDVGESLTFSLRNPDTTDSIDPNGDVQPFQGISIGTKSAQASTYHYVAYLEGNVIEEGDLSVAKNGTLLIDPAGDVLIDSITITKLTGSATKIGLGDIDILVPPNDAVLNFDFLLKDGDADPTTADINVSIDGNGDGVITNPIVAPASIDLIGVQALQQVDALL